MNRPIQFKKTTTLPLRITLALVLSCFGLSPMARAVIPAPDGGYAKENTAEGKEALFKLETGGFNTAIGFNALYSNTSGGSNTAIGHRALYKNNASFNTAVGLNALGSNTTGGNNTATGINALGSNFTGSNNTATGVIALGGNNTGSNNTATGCQAVGGNGNDNTGTGYQALSGNIDGVYNTATGFQAMVFSPSGSFNTANGTFALASNNAYNNTATGYQAMVSNTSGNFNTANGVNALFSNISANHNTATGFESLYSNTVGDDNTANGDSALLSNTEGTDNTAIGFQALFSNTTGTNNIAIGVRGGRNLTTGNNNIDIGNAGVAGESDHIRIGTQGTQKHTFIAGISGTTVAGGVRVIIDTNGHLGTSTPSARYKEAIRPMDKASEAILALKPVTFHYKKEVDPDGIPQFGLVAEQVEKVNPDLVARDEEGKVYTVRYEAVNAMLLNEFLKEHKKVKGLEGTLAQQDCKMQEQQTTIAELRKGIEILTAKFKEQAAQIQKVSAQLEVNKTTPQIVLTNQ
jgi:trimeric autotransporter adhesin